MIPSPTAGMRLSVYTDKYSRDATLNRSHGLDDITVVGVVDQTGATGEPNDLSNRTVSPLSREARYAEPTEKAPAYALVARHLFGDTAHPHLVLMPVVETAPGSAAYALPDNTSGPTMYGGSAAGTTDSRWSAILREWGMQHSYPLPLHDRHESWDLYRALSSD